MNQITLNAEQASYVGRLTTLISDNEKHIAKLRHDAAHKVGPVVLIDKYNSQFEFQVSRSDFADMLSSLNEKHKATLLQYGVVYQSL